MNTTASTVENRLKRRIVAVLSAFIFSALLVLTASFLPLRGEHLQSGPGHTQLREGGVDAAQTPPFLRGIAFALVISGLIEAIFLYRPLVRYLNGAQKRLSESVRHDVLTGCLNRRAFAEEAAKLFARARRYESGIAVLMVDVDALRQVNEQQGHDAGDQALQMIARLLLRNIREVDLAGRVDGEEFAVLLPESGLIASMLVAQRIRRAVAAEQTATLNTERNAIPITISVGVAVLQKSDASMGDAMRRAQRLSPEPKNTGAIVSRASVLWRPLSTWTALRRNSPPQPISEASSPTKPPSTAIQRSNIIAPDAN